MLVLVDLQPEVDRITYFYTVDEDVIYCMYAFPMYSVDSRTPRVGVFFARGQLVLSIRHLTVGVR